MIIMLHRVIGRSGSGKTEYMLNCLGEAIKNKKNCFVIVPEQQSVDYESILCDRFGDSVNLYCEVLNFERLPNRVAREFGGLAVNNMDKGGACALLSLVAESLKDNLTEYASVASDIDFAKNLFGLISRMKMGMITPQMLNESLNDASVSEDTRLLSKLRDISLIYSHYEKHFDENLYDPKDALTRLGNELQEKQFFKNTYVFIDGYYNFTQQEYGVIKEIIAQSKETYISFTYDEQREFFEENKKSAYRIAKLSKGNYTDFVTNEPNRTSKNNLLHIEKHLWTSNPPKTSADGSVELISARNRFDEVEAAASSILNFVRSGNRFRDVTILAENTDTYSSIIDSVFSRAGIPCYMSSKEDLATTPIFSFLLSSLAVINEDFSLRSIKRYVKSGFSGLSVAESDALLNYATSWNLRGRSWYSDNDWTLDPDGYREGDMTETAYKKLLLANAARSKVAMPLVALRESLKVKNLTISSAVRAIYTHLITMGADETLRKNAEKSLQKGNREESERQIQLWKMLINIIDQLDALCGEYSVNVKRLQSIIKLMCDCYSLGAIPASADSVTFGSASLIRAGGSKMVVVLGVCDGEFPSAVSMGGFFDREEAVTLESINLILADTMAKQLNTSRFFVYSAFSAPTEKLLLLSPRAELAGGELRQSSAWVSVKNMIKDLKETDFKDSDLLYSAEAIAANFPSISNDELRHEVEKALLNNKLDFSKEYPDVIDRESKINYKENILKLSPSKFETYIKCPFSFFGQYVLGLRQKKKNSFSVSEIGNFAHKLLDLFMRECVSTGKFVRPEDEERKSIITKLSQQYLADYIGKEAMEDKQFMHIYSNMVKTVDFVAEDLCNEFAESKFTPAGFEFKIGLGKDSDIPAIQYDADGKKVLLRGSIDRVDTYVSNGVTYVRVVDYKTYSKKLSADLVSVGLDTQLLHYLFAYCNKKGGVPAGALYYTVTLPNVTINGGETQDEIKKQLAKQLERNGFLLDNEDIIYAMSPDLSFVPVRYVKKYDKLMSNGLRTAEEFEQMSKELEEQVKNLANNVFCGNMDINPNDFDGKTNTCKYCPLGAFCRTKSIREEDEE